MPRTVLNRLEILGRTSRKVELSQLYRDVDTLLYSEKDEYCSKQRSLEANLSIVPSEQCVVILEHLNM